MQAIKLCLEKSRAVAIERIVVKARAELPDYQKRDIEELTAAVGRSYDNWCESILDNDLRHAEPNSAQAIQKNIAEGRDPAQVARTPWIICEVVLEILDKAGNQIDPTEKAEFTLRANRITTKMATIGQFKIAGALAERASSKFNIKR